MMKKSIIFLCFIIFMKPLLFASYAEALKLYEKKDYKNSLKMIASELQVANDAKPDSPNYNLRFLAAHNHWKLGNTKSAVDHFTRCMDINKKKVDPYIDLAMLQIEAKKYGDAENMARRGLELEKSPLLYYLLGLVSLKRENFWKAKEMFEKANSIDPELYVSYNAMGIALMRLKKYSEANTAFSAANAIKPKSAEILNNMGMSYEKLGKHKEALEYYENARAMDENNSAVAKNLARLKKK
jgi:tetratricopeptide (TPR) repeat protein